MKRVDELDLKGKRVLLRVDFNVPLNPDGSIADDTRIRLAIPTIECILAKGGSVILLSHLGRPKGTKDLKYSLKPCQKALEDLLKRPVEFAEEIKEELKPGSVLLLENLRFNSAEEKPSLDLSFGKGLASYGDCFVNDAFGTAHREHTSITELPKYFKGKSAAGFLMAKEIEALASFPSPFYAVIGGAKVSSKLGILKALSEKADGLFIGGAMAFTFLFAKKIPIGDSLYEPSLEKEALTLIHHCKERNIPLHFPQDLMISDGKTVKTIDAMEGIPPGWKGLDVGPKTVTYWIEEMTDAASVFWNGPLGAFEILPFEQGTFTFAKALTSLPGKTVVGGGDSVAAVKQLGISSLFTHISTGGGASLELLESGSLPGINSLQNE